MPEWTVAHARLQREGRASKVKYLSAAHATLQFPEPVLRARSDILLR